MPPPRRECVAIGLPGRLASTPTGRLAAMRNRIGTMLLALSIVQPRRNDSTIPQ
jgi:hypothetical protein